MSEVMKKSMRSNLAKTTTYASILFVTFLSCGKLVQPEESSTPGLRSLWSEYATQTYIMEQARFCFCPDQHGFVKLRVVDNEIVKGVDTESGDTLVSRELKWYKTIDELFMFIEEAEERKPAVLQVEYDTVYGYPKRIYVDQDFGIADEEMGFDTRLVQPFP